MSRNSWKELGTSWWSCQLPVAYSWGLLKLPNNFCRGVFKLNTKFDADSLFCSLSHVECDGHTGHMLTQWHLPPPLTSTVKWSLFTHAHSSPLGCQVTSMSCKPFSLYQQWLDFQTHRVYTQFWISTKRTSSCCGAKVRRQALAGTPETFMLFSSLYPPLSPPILTSMTSTTIDECACFCTTEMWNSGVSSHGQKEVYN